MHKFTALPQSFLVLIVCVLVFANKLGFGANIITITTVLGWDFVILFLAFIVVNQVAIAFTTGLATIVGVLQAPLLFP